MIRCRNSLLPFLLLAAFLSISAEDCNRTCGHNSVPYPFGFSPGCPIRLNCSKTAAILGGYSVRNITPDRILVDIPGDCNRGVGAVQRLFGKNYAMTAQNELFLRSCTSSVPSVCSISSELISERLDLKSCGGKGDSIRCYSDGRMDGYLSAKNISEIKCKSLFISVWYTGADTNQTELQFGGAELMLGGAELKWWMNGECLCSPNASCSFVNTSVPGKRGYTCACNEGFTGDGFAAGDGCKKGTDHSGNLKKKKIIIGVFTIAGVLAIVVGLSYGCLFLFSYVHHYRKSHSKNMQSDEDFLQKYGSMVPKRYKYLEIKKMTNSFSQKIGQGGYGSVFKGNLYDGHLVAVKVLSESKGNVEEFINEVASIGRTSHVNIVCLLGFCLEGSKRALVYEFMPNGSLEKFIYEETINGKIKLGWEKLYEIAVGIARGLEYLHCRCNTRIVHFDIKPHNILLDQDFCPKISDFGLAKLCPPKESIISMVGARGTVGFIAPEVFYRNFGTVSSKSDVYSYGMMVLEMVGGRKNIDARVENTSEIYFPHWIHDHLDQSNALETCGITSETEEIAKKMILVGLWCIQVQPTDRPSMSRVVDMLEGSVSDLQMPPKP